MRSTQLILQDVFSPRSVVASYVVFAFVSTALNLAAQQAAMTIFGSWTPFATPASVVFGTIVGFASKYLLDKNFIFMDQSRTAAEEIGKVFLYGLFGVGTTALFWACELGAFYAIGGTPAKFAGAAFGLVLGYIAKFLLDRRYTFAVDHEIRAVTLLNAT